MAVVKINAIDVAPERGAELEERFARRASEVEKMPALRQRRDGAWQDRSYAEVTREIDRLGGGFLAQGIEPGDRVCILANTRPEWSITAYALWSAGAVVVPIYPTNSPEECEWVVGKLRGGRGDRRGRGPAGQDRGRAGRAARPALRVHVRRG